MRQEHCEWLNGWQPDSVHCLYTYHLRFCLKNRRCCVERVEGSPLQLDKE